MKMLALKLAGPMQSWGYDSRFSRRSTASYPTLSGVVGLLANALGITREEPQRLAASGLLGLTIAVRVDRAGSLLSDYQTVQVNSGGDKKLLTRLYLQDAAFLVGVYDPRGEEDGLLEDLGSALKKPKHALFLGRKTCVPDAPILIGIFDTQGAEEFCQEQPWLGSENNISRSARAEAELKLLTALTDPAGSVNYSDQPISFSNNLRQYAVRAVKEEYVSIPNPFYQPAEESQVSDESPVAAAGRMDPMAGL